MDFELSISSNSDNDIVDIDELDNNDDYTSDYKANKYFGYDNNINDNSKVEAKKTDIKVDNDLLIKKEYESLLKEKDAHITALSEALLNMEKEMNQNDEELAKTYIKKNQQLKQSLNKSKLYINQLKKQLEQYKAKNLKQEDILNSYEASNLKKFKNIDHNISLTTNSLLTSTNTIDWKLKYDKLKAKQVDHRQVLSSLKSQLKKTRIALKKEIGNEINVDDFINNSIHNQYIGRAEIINKLKIKINQLKEQLGNKKGANAKKNPYLNKLSTDRNKQYQMLVEQNQHYNTTLKEYDDKFISNKLRITNLESLNKKLKKSLKIMIETKENDDVLIMELSTQLQQGKVQKKKIKKILLQMKYYNINK